jgi:hypothetical protein
MTIQAIEKEAAAIALRGEETRERAFARLLEMNPEAYADYKVQHNARPAIAALKAAGIPVRAAR